MGDVGDEVPALALRLRQRVRHVVKARRQLADLIAPVGVLHPHVEVPGGVGPRGLHHLPDGLDLPHGGQGGDDEHQQQDNGGGHEEQADEGPPHPHDGAGVHHRQHHADGLVAVLNGDAHHELFGGVGTAQTAAALIQAAARQDLLRDLLRDGHHLAPQPLVRRQQGIAAVVAHQKFGVGHGATQTDEALEVFILRLAAGLQVVHGHLSNETGPLLQLVPPLGEVIVIAQGEKGHAQQQQRQHHHAGGQGELLPVEPAEPFLALCHHFTSNL